MICMRKAATQRHRLSLVCRATTATSGLELQPVGTVGWTGRCTPTSGELRSNTVPPFHFRPGMLAAKIVGTICSFFPSSSSTYRYRPTHLLPRLSCQNPLALSGQGHTSRCEPNILSQARTLLLANTTVIDAVSFSLGTEVGIQHQAEYIWTIEYPSVRPEHATQVEAPATRNFGRLQANSKGGGKGGSV